MLRPRTVNLLEYNWLATGNVGAHAERGENHQTGAQDKLDRQDRGKCVIKRPDHRQQGVWRGAISGKENHAPDSDAKLHQSEQIQIGFAASGG